MNVLSLKFVPNRSSLTREYYIQHPSVVVDPKSISSSGVRSSRISMDILSEDVVLLILMDTLYSK